MDYQQLRSEFQQQVYPSRPNEWDIEDALSDLEDLEDRQQRLLLRSIPAIWPVSHSLSFSFLKEGARKSDELDGQLLAEWLRRILQNYEEGGLIKARSYMAKTDIAELSGEKSSRHVRLADYHSRLTAFARGLGASEIILQEGREVYTDTETIYLPDELGLFSSSRENLLHYKFLAGVQVVFICLGSLGLRRFVEIGAVPEAGEQGLTKHLVKGFFDSHHHGGLARDLYQLMELRRVFECLRRDYPGLLRESYPLRLHLCRRRFSSIPSDMRPLDALLHAVVLPENDEPAGGGSRLSSVLQTDTAADDQSRFEALYKWAEEQGCGEDAFTFEPFMGRFRFGEAERAIARRVIENKKKFATALADVIRANDLQSSENNEMEAEAMQADGARIQLQAEEGHEAEIQRANLSIDNMSIELPEDLLELINRIHADLGQLPRGYVSAAFGIAGRGVAAGEGNPAGEEVSERFLSYDEWDYRRHGYRRNWCSLRQRPLRGTKSDFVANTLVKHRGVLLKIRRQFEMMRTQERFAKRRRYGDDLDLDAVIDSLGDRAAGLPPSEKLFTRLVRDDRSIATFFLVDMSNSTEGWIGVAIKEALVLLCEAMEVVGDSYAIYGFSGMRRMRSEVYGIKEVTERYSEEVKRRIAAITPKEYTRMGPPIRHMVEHFKGVEAKSRLLLILSDGKPEDYDDYKGQYAIEDTRKALAEARGRGVHPYCITIDRQAHEYLEYLFGRGNYTYVKNIDQLPSRLTEIYRLLTR